MYKEIEDIWEWESPCRFYWSFLLHITNPEFIIKMETEKKNTWEFVFGIEKLKMPSWISNVIVLVDEMFWEHSRLRVIEENTM